METTEVMQQVKEMYLKGMTRNKIAEAMGLEQYQVGHMLYSKMMLQRSNPRHLQDDKILKLLTPHQINRILTLATFGYNVREIAEDQQIGYLKVKRLLSVAEHKNMIERKV